MKRARGSVLRGLVFFAAVCGGLLVASDASAQQPPPAAAGNPPAAGATGDGTQVAVQNQGGRRVYVATGVIEVRGEIQRPYAFSLSGRASLGYSYLDVPVHFVQEIINAVRRAPF